MSDFRESSNDYYAVVVVLNDSWRVIDSKESYPYRQWVLQQRNGKEWRGKSFCQTRAVLERDIRRKVGDIGEEAQRVLASLPDRDMGQKLPKEIAV